MKIETLQKIERKLENQEYVTYKFISWEMAQYLTALATFVENPGLIHGIYSASQTSITPVPINLISSSDFFCHKAQKLDTNIHAGKRPIHIKRNKILCSNFPGTISWRCSHILSVCFGHLHQMSHSLIAFVHIEAFYFIPLVFMSVSMPVLYSWLIYLFNVV